MDRWKAEVVRVKEEKRREGREEKRRDEKRREEETRSKRENLRRKKIQVPEKVGKSRNTAFFQWFGAPEGRKVGSLKRRVRSHLARWEMKNCTPLWREATTKCTNHTILGALLQVEMSKQSKQCIPFCREAHFLVNMYKAHQDRSTFWSCDAEKVHAVVARSLFEVKSVKKLTVSDHFWKLRCRKSGPCCVAKIREAHFQVKMYKTHQDRSTFWSWDVEKVHIVVARSTFPSLNVKSTTFGPLLDVQFRCRFSRGRRKGLCTLSKIRKMWRFCHNFNYNHHYTT